MSRMIAHALNAKIHKLPRCAECEAPKEQPCTTPSGFICAPHKVRERAAAGEVFVVFADDARRRRMLRAVSELAATMPRRRQ